MKLTPINAQRARDGIDKQGEDGFPSDWHNDITARGVSRNAALGHYTVQLAVSGTQFFLGTAYSQPTAALIYDYGVWKFAGKMSRAAHVNFPETFSKITQADIDRDCPRLNEIYLKVPFLSETDALKSEAELRAPRIQSSGFLAPLSPGTAKDFYLTVLRRLKRLRLQTTENYEHVTDWHRRLGLEKVPDVYNRLSDVSSKLAALSIAIGELEPSMESNHGYYRKVKYGQEI